MDDKQKIIDLHEQVANQDRELDKLREELSKAELSSEKAKAWWKSPQGIVAITGLLGLLLTTGENQFSRTQQNQRVRIDEKTSGAVSEFLLQRQAALEEDFLDITDAILISLPPEQQRSTVEYLERNGVEYELPELLYEESSEGSEETVAESSSIRRFASGSRIGYKPDRPPASLESAGDETVDEGDNIYDMVQKKIEAEESVPPSFKELEEKLEKKKKVKRSLF